MSTLTQNAQLLLQNKKAQVEALNEVGFTEVTMETPLSEIAGYMKWCGGLRDLALACVKKQTGEKCFFTGEEWEAMSANEHSKYVKSGVRIRAEGKQFVIARENCTTDTATKFTWGPTNEDIAGLKNYADTNVGVYEDFDYRANTDAIIAQGTAQGTTHPAAEAANSYTTCKKSTEGVDDPWSWGLPTVPMVMMFYRYRTQLNSFLNTYFGSSYQLTSDWHWTSNEWSSAYAWNVYVYNGYVYNINLKGNSLYVRAVSAI
jgi:hypothetical protein